MRNFLLLLLLSSCATVPLKKAEVKQTHEPKLGIMEIEGKIDGLSVSVWEEELKELDAENDLIVIVIDSEGGSVPAGYRMIKAMERAKHPIACVVDRSAMSMAFVILQSCDYRAMTTRSILMVHKPYAVGFEMDENDKRFLKALTESMAEEVALRMKVSAKFILAVIDQGDWFMTKDNALVFGAVDSVVRNVDSLLAHPPESLLGN